MTQYYIYIYIYIYVCVCVCVCVIDLCMPLQLRQYWDVYVLKSMEERSL